MTQSPQRYKQSKVLQLPSYHNYSQYNLFMNQFKDIMTSIKMWFFTHGKWVQILRSSYPTDEEYYRAILRLKGTIQEPSQIDQLVREWSL